MSTDQQDATAVQGEPAAAPGDRRRAAPMAPEDRRAAIVEAVSSIVAERGAAVTTKELAAAAGVAEGTLFRVFPDKIGLVGEVAIRGLRTASDPRRTREELASVDRSLPLEERVAQVVELGRARMSDVIRWMTVLRGLAMVCPPDLGGERASTLRAELAAQRELQRAVTVEGLTAALAPDADRLRVPVAVAVAILESAIAGTHGRVDHLLPALPPRVLADALVHGLVHPPTARPKEN